MNEAVSIAKAGIDRFTEHNPEIKEFVQKLNNEITERSNVAMRLANIFCAHESMKSWLPMFISGNDAMMLTTLYSFLENMEMAINGAGQLMLVRVNCRSGCWQAFLVKDEKIYDKLISNIRDEMFAMTDETIISLDVKQMTWHDMVKLVETAIEYIDVDELFDKALSHIGFSDGVNVNIYFKSEK